MRTDASALQPASLLDRGTWLRCHTTDTHVRVESRISAGFLVSPLESGGGRQPRGRGAAAAAAGTPAPPRGRRLRPSSATGGEVLAAYCVDRVASVFQLVAGLE